MSQTADNPPPWLSQMSTDIWAWLGSLQTQSGIGYYKFSDKGSLFETTDTSGLGISCLALKLTYMLGLKHLFRDNQLDGWIEMIRSFQTDEGFFEDPALLSVLDKRSGLFHRDEKTRSAETRQACAALMCYNRAPNKPLPPVPMSKNAICKFMNKLRWDIPYASASHVSHLMAFHKINRDLFSNSDSHTASISIIVEELDKLRDPKTGTWYRRRNAIQHILMTLGRYRAFIVHFPWSRPWRAGPEFYRLARFLKIHKVLSIEVNRIPKSDRVNEELDETKNVENGLWFNRQPSSRQLINGAMKIITGYSFCDIEFGKPEGLIDICLDHLNKADGCDNADIVYVLHKCHSITSYRSGEIREYALDRIEHIRQFRVATGGFSYFLGRSQTSYYGVPVTSGLHSADIHGTTLFIWSLVMLADILGWRDKLGWELPVT
ncbi:MAG: hypothetical protein QF530_02550 [SAR202 cluster bacterium]|jgi:hypothetical protein|nr:hypothetical protein [SAR202 cluster bacterium]